MIHILKHFLYNVITIIIIVINFILESSEQNFLEPIDNT